MESKTEPMQITDPNDGHKAAINDMHFNPKIWYYMCSVAQDGKVLVWDINDISKPLQPKQPIPGVSVQSSPSYTCAWNEEMPNIIAAGNDRGQTNIFDIRQQKHLLTLNSSAGGSRSNCLSWKPDEK